MEAFIFISRSNAVAFFLAFASLIGIHAAFPIVVAADTKALTRPAEILDWDVESIIAALKWRESVLGNCSCRFTEDLWGTRPGQQEVHLENDKLEIRYSAPSMWLRHSVHMDSISQLDLDDQVVRWDGLAYTWIEGQKLPSGEIKMHGGIDTAKPQVLRGLLMTFTVLGQNVETHDGPWSRWIKWATDIKTTAAVIETGGDGDDQYVRLTLTTSIPRGPTYKFAWLPKKDFVLKEYSLTFPARRDNKDIPVTQRITVSTAVKIDGFWMPKESQFVRAENDPNGSNRGRCILEDFSSKPPKSEDMAVEFKPGTLVMDSINHELYQLNADGTRIYKPFIDPPTGKIVRPHAQASTQE